MSIYTRPQRMQKTLTVGHGLDNPQLPFTARGVIAYNHSDQHVELVDEGLFIPPKISGWMMPIKDAGSANVAFGAPPSSPDPPPTAGQICNLIFTEEDVLPSSGVPDGVINVQTPWHPCGAHVTTVGGETFTTTPVGPGALTLGIALYGGVPLIDGLLVQGHQSGTIYEVSPTAAPQGGTTQTGFFTVIINAALDSTYDIAWQLSNGPGITVEAFWSALVMGFPALGQNVMGESVPVAIASDQSPVSVRNGAARRLAFVAGARANGTYTFELAVPEETDLKGLIVYFHINAGPGNVTFTISRHDDNTGADSPLLTSLAQAANALGTLAIYPGIAVVANVTASQIVGHSPMITAVVAGGGADMTVYVDPVP